jgi:Leucine-rich repeat (LRR) protein
VMLFMVWCVPAGHGQAVAPAKTLKISQRNQSLLGRLGNYPDLEILSINCLEELHALPDSIGKLAKLKQLIIDNGNGCSMNPLLPDWIGNLHLLEKLVLYGAQDPGGTGAAPPKQPKERHKFPDSMSQLKNLNYLDLGRNGLDEIPAFVKDLPRLRELRFQWNKLKAVPPFIVNLHELSTLMLDGNDLDDLPSFLNTLPKLTRVTLGNNCSISENTAKMNELRRKVPRVKVDFTEEYDCPAR